MNSINVTGRLTRDPELRSTAKDTAVCDVRLAVDGYREDQTTFVDVRSFGPSAKAAGERLRSGDLIEVSGSLEYDQWDAKDGSGKRSKLYIVGRIGFLQQRKRDS